ncbi:MAG: mannose-1-phosphate guanylyltransferase [bacterium]
MGNYICILAGGSGTRLWPLSTKSKPKQFAKLFSDKTLLRETYERVAYGFPDSNIYISVNINDLEECKKEIPEISEQNFICEPSKRDTGPAICLIAAYIAKIDPDAYICTTHSDSYIPDTEAVIKIMKSLFAVLGKRPDSLLAIGINPNYPDTGLGYIEMGDPIDRINGELIFSINSFTEKPDKETAIKFVQSWKYLWNMGNYGFKASWILEEYKKQFETIHELITKYINTDGIEEKNNLFSQCEKIAFEKVICEKAEKRIVIPGNFLWSDVGNWRTIYEILGKRQQNSIIAKYEADRNLVLTKKKVALMGVKNIAIIESPDAILVCDLSYASELKKIVEQLPEEYL